MRHSMMMATQKTRQEANSIQRHESTSSATTTACLPNPTEPVAILLCPPYASPLTAHHVGVQVGPLLARFRAPPAPVLLASTARHRARPAQRLAYVRASQCDHHSIDGHQSDVAAPRRRRHRRYSVGTNGSARRVHPRAARLPLLTTRVGRRARSTAETACPCGCRRCRWSAKPAWCVDGKGGCVAGGAVFVAIVAFWGWLG